jgi:hypothetical protein
VKPCIICDIDGTIANADHRLHLLPKMRDDGSYVPSGQAWKEFHEAAVDDTPHLEIVHLANAVHASGVPVILCTGRGDETREQTIEWLSRHGVRWLRLFMRPYKDNRPDNIVKSEMLDAILADGWKPLFVVEDRARVVQMWRERGVRCLQVCEGDY